MRILAACSLGGAGHLNPLLPFHAAARRRGDDICVVAPPALGEIVALAGYRFWAGGAPPDEDVAHIRERLAVAPAREASVLGNRELFGRLATTAMLPAMERICAEWRPDLVLREPCEYASAVVAPHLGIPTAQVAISLAEVEAGATDLAAPALEQHRAGLVSELLAAPYLTRFPASLDPSAFPTTIRFHEPRSGRGRELPDRWGGARGPIVYLTFGTVLGHMSIAAGVYRAAMKAVAGKKVRALLTVGPHFDPAHLGPLPAHVHVEAWVEQEEVFDHASLVVCHGGSGTVFGAMAAGVPVVVVPAFADQFENGRRIAATGAGLVVEADQATADVRRTIGEEDAPRISDAIDEVLATVAFRRHARAIAAEIEATPTVDDVLNSLATGAIGGRG